MTQQQVLAIITAQPLNFTPGSRFAYSNAGYFLLGMILERATSKTYAQLLRDFFLEPLSLNRTGVCGTQTPSPNGYLLTSSGAFPVQAAEMSLPFSAGSICSTSNDLVRWTLALADGRVVSPESYARMTTSVDPSTTPPPGYGYGLVVTPLDGRRRIWHNGAILGFQSHVAYFPDEQLTIAVVVNVHDPARDQATLVANEIARAMK
jgi:CubicO group peptidase (beta-lactamase class C family)